MGNKMLIDAAHPEETRVVVVHGNRVEEFDFESEAKKQLRGNIYLAKVTRVEPSLQAAFVEYGGNRHGFLAFNEIHPDYYQIPVADREALLKEWAADEREEESDEAASDEDDVAETEDDASASADASDDNDADEDGEDDSVEAVGSEDALEEVARKKQRKMLRSYKIQEVIKRRQVILVQVVKEERGNKGAALTTYLSLAGRYCVLMPNTARGGGISRKIQNGSDRKRLKAVAEGLDVQDGMGLIIRTAGAKRTKAEIKRDFEYLLRLWERVRDLTLESSAPALVYEEGNLVKRSIRDLYSKDIDSVLVEGEAGYREAKDFMRMLMPSHAKNVQPYKEREPIFQRHDIEPQLNAMFSPIVTLKSGGYLVINQAEALVAIDVNSGRSTKERNIEATALKTNLEAAAEVSRQMRLRDLAGLIVIDFIDMDENRNNRAVERKLKECLKSDRARIQVGRISHFGLLEMSRQRMRAGIIEGSTVTCPTCNGAGLIRSVESTALHVLRSVEAEAIKGKSDAFTVKVPQEVAIYILNQKRANLLAIEGTYGVSIFIETDRDIHGDEHRIETAPSRVTQTAVTGSTSLEAAYEGKDLDDAADATDSGDEDDEEQQPKRKRRRRRRRRKSEADGETESNGDTAEDDAEASDDEPENEDAVSEATDANGDAGEDGDDGDDKPKRRRRRGRRGGRRNRRGDTDSAEENAENAEESADADAEQASDETDDTPEDAVLISYSRDAEAPIVSDSSAASASANDPEDGGEEAESGSSEEVAVADTGADAQADDQPDAEPEAEAEAEVEAEAAEAQPAQPTRTGWWRRRSSAD